MKRFPFLTLLSAILIMASCTGSQDSGDSSASLLSLKGGSSKSVYLSIVDQTEQADAFVFKVSATYENDTVGFNLAMDKDIAAGINEDGTVNEADGFVTGNIRFLRSGEESDRFIRALAEIWEITPENPAFSAEPVLPLVFSSNKAAVDPGKQSTNNFKLFFNPDAAEPGELFFTHDTYHRRIELQEKDTIYRQEILRALTGSPEPVPVDSLAQTE